MASGTPQSVRRRVAGVSAQLPQRLMDDSFDPRPRPGTPPAGHRGGKAPGAENIVAAVRVRGFLPRELERGDELCIRMRNQTCEISCPGKGKSPFTFDHCFWSVRDFEGISDLPYAGQDNVYSTLGMPVVENALAGFNAAVIAYGQTGSGKSYSIFGPPDSLGTELEGLVPRMCKALFTKIDEQAEAERAKEWIVSASMIEIYMEKVYDLLNNRNPLQLRGDLQRGFNVPGRVRKEVKSYKTIEDLLQCGEMKRTVASTALNERSSRAHTLFELEIRHITESRTTTSKLTLCDLAGSERCKDAKTEIGGKEFNQACQINMSLLNLGKCVESVVQRGHESLVTEFRNSTLTKLLKDSIGGNSKTVILTTISPSANDVYTTMQALRFADRAKQIQLHAVINDDALWEAKNKARLMQRFYQSRIDALNKEYELEKQAADLTEQQLQLESEMARVYAERDALRAQKAQMTRSRAISDAERQKFEKREAELQARLKEVNQEHESLQHRMEQLEGQNAKHCADTQAVKREKEELEEEICFLQGKIELLRKELEDQGLAALAWEEERSGLKREHSKEIERLKESQAVALERKEDTFVDERKRYVEQMMEAVAKLQKDMQHKEERWAEKEDSWRQKIRERERIAEDVRAEREILQKQLQEKEFAAQRAEEGMAEAVSRASALNGELLAKTRESDATQDQLTTAKWGQEEASQRIAALHKELSIATARLADAHQELQLAAGAAEECITASGHADVEASLSLPERLTSLADAVRTSRRAVEEQKDSDRRKQKAAQEEMESLLSAKESELAAAKEAFVRGDGELRKQISELGGEVRRLGLELSKERRSHSEKIASLEAEYKSKLDETRAETQSSTRRAQNLDTRLTEVTSNLRAAEERLEESEAEHRLKVQRLNEVNKASAAEGDRALKDHQALIVGLEDKLQETAQRYKDELDQALSEVLVERGKSSDEREKMTAEMDKLRRKLEHESQRAKRLETELRASQEEETQRVQSLMQVFQGAVQRTQSDLQAAKERVRLETAESKKRVSGVLVQPAGGGNRVCENRTSCGSETTGHLSPVISSPSAGNLTPPRKSKASFGRAADDKENRYP